MRVVQGNKGPKGPTRDNPGLNTDQMQVKINMNDASDLTCDECGHKYFTQLMMFKKISAVMSPTGEESLVPIQVFACNSCGHVNEQFIPPTGQ